ncbi:pathogen-related protein [Stemphylium lycopersici]|nr:pathogen-related protein [Stemphylium lycopersici]
MASVDVQHPPAQEVVPALPDYLTSPNAVLGDKDAEWRYGRAPDYSKTRKVYAETKQMTHEAGSLPELVQNLVKNWEVEASFKPNIDDWRTIDREKYSFAINGGKPEGAENMLKVGTYNAIIAPNEYYSPDYSDFASSHKTFKRMMPTFAWEVLEVYSGPPTVSFRWRHWGQMKNDYVGFNNKGEKVIAKAHGGSIDIQGVTVATVNDKVQLQDVRTWFDPMDMFRQIAPNGAVRKEDAPKGLSPAEALDEAQANVKVPEEQELPDHTIQTKEELEQTISEIDEKRAQGTRPQDVPDGHPAVGESSAEEGASACLFMARGFS